MRPAVTAAQMRAIEARATALGVPTASLMANAGAALAQLAAKHLAQAGRCVVVCGPGNNGGDGFVAALRLASAGQYVVVQPLTDTSSGDAGSARDALRLAHPEVLLRPVFEPQRGDVVIDAIFGTGLSREPTGPFADAITRINAWRTAGATVVSADVPSGLDADEGRGWPSVVTADHTVCFGCLKRGLAIEPGASLAGQVSVVDIGVPRAALEALAGDTPVVELEEADAIRRLPPRAANTHKGTYGHVLLIAGSPGKSGAAALAGLGALRGGAGLVTVAAREDGLSDVLRHAPELMGAALGSDGGLAPADELATLQASVGKAALVVGPGLNRGPGTPAWLEALLGRPGVPLVLDADGLNALAGHLDALAAARRPVILTPHPAELARLTELTTTQVNADRLGVSTRFAVAHSCVIVLKGARTVIASPNGAAFINPTGNAGMATGGTGDVLAGLIGALCGQGLAPLDAAIVGVFAHGLAGDLAAAQHGKLGLIASDVAHALGQVWVRWTR